MTDRTRQATKWIALFAITGLVCLVLGEVGARLYFRLTTGTSAEPVLTGTVGEYDQLLGARLLPGVHADFVGPEFDTHFQTNSHRVREAEETPYERPPATSHRILLAGDSFTFGHGVNDPERYGEQLEEEIPGLDVVNTGVWGTGTDQQYLLYLDEGRKYDVDLVVLGYFVENIVRNGTSVRFITGGRAAHKPRFVLREGVLELTNVPVPEPGEDSETESAERERWNEVVERQGTGVPIPFKSFLRDHSAFYKLLHARLADAMHKALHSNAEPYPEYDESREEWQVTEAIFSAFADAVRAEGAEFLIMIIPAKEYVTQDYVVPKPNQMIAEFGRTHDIPVLDLLPAFRAVDPARRADLYFRMDAHWSPKGHALAAKTLAAYLHEHYGW